MSKDLLLEIGTEEVPAHVMPHLLTDLKRLAGDLLAEHRLAYESLRTIGTPRRSALLVTGLAERQEDVSTETRGPSVAIAFDAEGNPTPPTSFSGMATSTPPCMRRGRRRRRSSRSFCRS